MSRDKQKILGIVIVILILAYHFGRPTLERVLGIPLPALMAEDPGPQTVDTNESQPTASQKSRDTSRSGNQLEASNPPEKKTGDALSKFKLKELSRNDLESPAGLIYGMGPGGEHRVDHVMGHGADNPSRPVHSVFNGDKTEILKLIDEAYGLIKSNDKRVQQVSSPDYPNRMEYTVNMQRPVGYKGGRNGQRDGFPPLNKVRLILEKNRVITAYPY